MRRQLLQILTLCCITIGFSWPLTVVGQQAQQAADTLVVCPPEFQQALQPWVEYRMQQGHNLKITSPQTSEKLRATIHRMAGQNTQLKTVVLVGDTSGDNIVPTNYVKANVNVLYGGQPDIATDNPYVDLDNDGTPELAIGRLTVDSPAELTKTINRIIEYEKEAGGEWLQRINFIAGVGGFGGFIDTLIEQTAKQMITEIIPGGYKTTMTYGSWTSPYCPDPSKFDETSVAKFNEGCLFWVYIGHGATHFLDRVRLPDRSHRILDRTNVETLAATSGSPIALFLACSTGGFDHAEDCLAETMLKQDKGPIAVIASTRVAMPYGLSLFTLEITQDYFSGDSATIGDLVKVAKRNLILNEDKNPSEYRQIIEAMGRSFSPKPELLLAERREHADSINLLGDPLLRVKRAEKLGLTGEVDEQTGTVQLSGSSPISGTAQIAVSLKRDRLRQRVPRRSEYDPSEFESYQTAYEQAQKLVCGMETQEIKEGDFDITVPIPESASGECVVQIYLQSENGFAIDSVPVRISRKRKPANKERADKEPTDKKSLVSNQADQAIIEPEFDKDK